MRRTLLAIGLAASAVAGCRPTASAPIVVPSPAAEMTEPVAPSSAPLPTAAPKTPGTGRVTLSNAPLVGDDRPQLLFQVPGEHRLRAIAWADATNGVLVGEVASQATVWPSPDGRRYVLNGKIYAAGGRELGALPWDDTSLPTWSPDGQLLCRALPESPRTGAPMELQTVVPGQRPRTVATGYGTYSDNAGYPVLACDAATDRVIVASLGQGLFAGHLWVFRLSTGALIRSEDLGANAAGSWLAASADGTLLAHSVQATLTDRPTTIIRAADSPTALQTLPSFEGHAFSGDGTLLVGVAGADVVAIVDWKTARRTWSVSGQRYGGSLAEPDGTHVAVELTAVGLVEGGAVHIVGPDGTSVSLPPGVRASLRY